MSKRRGFTIIEVVLVLAIGGLIFLMVFIALPSLQRSQRNSQRRRDVDRVHAAIIDYQKHNKGKLPFSGTKTAVGVFDKNFASRYIDSSCEFNRQHTGAANYGYYTFVNCGEQFTAPDGEPYEIAQLRSDSSTANFDQFMANTGNYHVIFVANRTKCSELEGGRTSTGKANDFIVASALEGGSMYCRDNS